MQVDRDDDEEEEEESKEKRKPSISELMRQGRSTMSIFEQMYTQSLRATLPKSENEDTRTKHSIDSQAATGSEHREGLPETNPIHARTHMERTLQEYYDDCNFESGVSSFTDFMQSQFTKHNMYVVPTGYAGETNFAYFNQGKQLWKSSGDLRDDLEDKFRHQLEKSDLL